MVAFLTDFNKYISYVYVNSLEANIFLPNFLGTFTTYSRRVSKVVFIYAINTEYLIEDANYYE